MHTRRRSGRIERGVTLIEVLIVVAIMALVATGVAIAAIKYYQGAKVRMADTNARAIREAVKAWWFVHESVTCPTVAELMSSGALDEGSARTDPWGGPWRIECSEAAVTVLSDGPDRSPGTLDDIRVPPKSS